MKLKKIVIMLGLVFSANYAVAADVTVGTGITTSNFGTNVVVGNNAAVTHPFGSANVVVGDSASTVGAFNGVVVGTNASITSNIDGGVVVGSNATMSGNGGVVIGKVAQSTGTEV